MTSYIPLARQFSFVPHDQEEAEKNDYFSLLGHDKPKSWDALHFEYRCVILAEAGAGKTEEFLQQAKLLDNQGKPSFFIRIEDIESGFEGAFEVGDENRFKEWLNSTSEAWFFLDSVDEARLDHPRTFEKALRYFATSIKGSAHRAHIYLSSRPYAWRPKEDRRLLDNILFLPGQQEGEASEESTQAEPPPSALTVYTLRPLNEEMVRRFCVVYEAKDIDRLLHEIERANLWSLAERPFDLEGILAKWEDDKELGGRLALLRHNIDKRLRDDHNTNRAQRQPLNIEKARQGARRLAAAVILTGKPGLNVPDKAPVKPGIEAESVLADWNPKDVRALLERGIFNDVIYGTVRFRHREVRELLAAEWFDELLKTGNSRHTVETLFFREQYGEKIVTPRLRAILPWLILFDDEIRCRSLAMHPEIAVEGGEPSQLPLSTRQGILADIVRRIVSDEDDRSARDNSAIARIANSDLTKDTERLIHEFADNDDAIFFLGRLVWQGEMAVCVPLLAVIAIDDARDIYARIASVRAVMTCGSAQQKQNLWQALNQSDAQMSRELLAELVSAAEPDGSSVEQLLISMGKLPPYERFKVTRLGHTLHKFVANLPVVGDQQALIQLLDGLHGYLEKPPYVERGKCHVSQDYAWLLNPVTYVIERLAEARSSVVLGTKGLSVLLMIPALRVWQRNGFDEIKSKVQALVQSWPELNDALYWASIEQARSTKVLKSDKPLIDDWAVSCRGHYWAFDTASLPRLLDYMRSRTLLEDRMVALSTAFRVFVQADRPSHILTGLHDAVTDNSALQDQLDSLLNPPVSEVMQEYEQELAECQREWAEKEKQNKQAREDWIAELRINPDGVRNPTNSEMGELTNDQYWLLCELLDNGFSTNRSDGANWQALIPDFGETVARAYRDAAISYWRHYVPSLKSEGDRNDNTVPYSLIFAMAGLEIEVAEEVDFPHNLNESQARHALRYITWELNGFPGWFERMYQAFPDLVEEAVLQEMRWELENTESENPMHYILSNLVYHASWLHAAIAPTILKWVEANPVCININSHHCMHILLSGGTDPIRFSSLARQQIDNINDPDSIPAWYALRVDCDPVKGITEFQQWLTGLGEEMATRAAQIFITTLMGDRRGGGYPQVGHFRTAEHLKALYVLMHHHIRINDDIDRAGKGAYSPELRDDAQRARNQLFGLLSEIPGKASYSVIKQLANDHPDPNSRPWMVKQAYKRAEEDGDLEPWTAEQVYEFNKTQILTPMTHHQLFDLAIHRLHDMKNWIECGNDSPWQTWQRAKTETELRRLIAGWLNQQCRSQYVTAQEPELANRQRMDICLHNTNVQSPVPIELKLLDKGWSGPKLCERLCNQLAGDYLREESAGCGVMLLVWQGTKPLKRWEINGRLVLLRELADGLKSYWQDIADQFPNVEVMDVVVIDLTERGQVSIM